MHFRYYRRYIRIRYIKKRHYLLKKGNTNNKYQFNNAGPSQLLCRTFLDIRRLHAHTAGRALNQPKQKSTLEATSLGLETMKL